ncbi:MAG: S9 family peptidase, partial [Anaerococcus sp.]|nr:S9 family peptidase [Anaerococcus sp.]
MSKTKIKDILGYDFLSNLDISKDGEKLAYIKTKANYDHNKYESDLWIYNTKKAETFPITDNKNISIFTFNQDSNLVYKAKSDDKKDTFYIYNGYGIGKKIFDIDLEVKSIKFLKDDLYLINASNKKEEENKYFEKLDTLPFWLNSQGYLKKEESSYYFYKANDGKLVKIIDSKFPNEIYRLSLNEDLSKVIFIKAN